MYNFIPFILVCKYFEDKNNIALFFLSLEFVTELPYAGTY